MLTASLLLLALVCSATAKSCTWNGQTGQCATSCPGGDFTSYNHDSSSGGQCRTEPANVKCCTPKASQQAPAQPNQPVACTFNGQTGQCKSSCPDGVLSAFNVPGAGGECGNGVATMCCTPTKAFTPPANQPPVEPVPVDTTPVQPGAVPQNGRACQLNGVVGVCVSAAVCNSATHEHTAWNFPGGDGACKVEPVGVLCCTQKPASGNTPAEPAAPPAVPTGVASCNNPAGADGQCINESQCPSPLRAYASSEGATGCRRFPAAVKCCSQAGAQAAAPSAPAGGSVDGVSQAGVELIKEFEGFYANAYRDPLSGGLPITIGWGSTRKENGQPFRLGDTITRTEAEKLLINQLKRDYIPPMASRIPTWNQMNSNQQGAITSFGYNLGAHFYGNSRFATITRVLGSPSSWRTQIRSALLLYRNPGTNVEAGLRRRRNREADLFLRGASNLEQWEEELAEKPVEDAPLSSAVIIGIIVAIVVALSLIALCIFCFALKSMRSDNSDIHVTNEMHTAHGGDEGTTVGYGTGDYQCDMCGKSYAYAEDLAEHVAARHN